MPEMTFTVRWPDGTEADLYSPSLIMHDHLTVGAEYPVEEFVYKTSTALDEASERVKARYGFECTSARAHKSQIVLMSEQYRADEPVTVLDMQPPLPKDVQ